MDGATPRSFRATVQYDGAAYQGFQRQRRGPQGQGASIQEELESALARLAGRPVRVTGAGRTDTGVHALGQVVGFTIEWPTRHGDAALLRALNAHLPPDIAICALAEAPVGFHPRFDARRRTYEYRVVNTPVRQPLLRQRAWHVAAALDEARMNAAAGLLLGVHDFATFGRAPVGDTAARGGNTVRQVYLAEWRREGDMLLFRVCANAFLYRMVRSLVGSLRKVGEGRWSVDDFAAALAARDRKRSASAAPAHGLYLVAVDYDSAVAEYIDGHAASR
ncbi:MAG TPA: tRNA pseudouridine(38-40) synthase TruA [Promineifilum sp.]|nr:tRNA pseudouridine(38-40) synthase TruA [Promineifilum sp.]